MYYAQLLGRAYHEQTILEKQNEIKKIIGRKCTAHTYRVINTYKRTCRKRVKENETQRLSFKIYNISK